MSHPYRIRSVTVTMMAVLIGALAAHGGEQKPDVYFVAGDPVQTYEGVVEGGRIVGTTTKADGKTEAWSAERKP